PAPASRSASARYRGPSRGSPVGRRASARDRSATAERCPAPASWPPAQAAKTGALLQPVLAAPRILGSSTRTIHDWDACRDADDEAAPHGVIRFKHPRDTGRCGTARSVTPGQLRWHETKAWLREGSPAIVPGTRRMHA